ncbi:MAG: hypothetical protein MI976_10190 [Pseudomonadales bacterium]|nr:hypothetical protein [Pseudomonadales bacterium]
MGERNSAYIRYRASEKLDGLVLQYIEKTESQAGEPDLELLLEVMDLFVAESVETFVLRPSEMIDLRSGFLKMIHSLCHLVEKSAHMLVRRVAKKMTPQDHINAAQYMKQVRIAYEENGKQVGDISFPLQAADARLGVETRDKILNGGADDPVIMKDAIKFLHAVIDVSNYWVFEEPVRILNLRGVIKTLAIKTVNTVKKTTHSLIEKLVPKLSEHQRQASAKYFSNLVGVGPYIDTYGEVDQETASRMQLT